MGKTYIISLFSGCIILALCGVCTYQYTVLSNERMLNQAEEEEAPGTAVLAASEKEDIMTRDTEYIIEKYDASTLQLTEETAAVPIEMLGLDREETIDYVSQYKNSPTIEDVEAGFISAEVLSFSREKVIVRKNYEGKLDSEALTQDCYILVAENGFVSVYQNDYHHFYMTTDIKLESLSEELQQEMMDGKIVYSVQELYHFMETYTS